MIGAYLALFLPRAINMTIALTVLSPLGTADLCPEAVSSLEPGATVEIVQQQCNAAPNRPHIYPFGTRNRAIVQPPAEKHCDSFHLRR